VTDCAGFVGKPVPTLGALQDAYGPLVGGSCLPWALVQISRVTTFHAHRLEEVMIRSITVYSFVEALMSCHHLVDVPARRHFLQRELTTSMWYLVHTYRTPCVCCLPSLQYHRMTHLSRFRRLRLSLRGLVDLRGAAWCSYIWSRTLSFCRICRQRFKKTSSTLVRRLAEVSKYGF